MNPAKPKQVMSHPMPRQLYYELQLLVGIDQCMVGRASYQTGSKRITSVFWLCAPTPSYSTCSSPLELFTLPMASLRVTIDKESNVIGLRFQVAILQVSRLEYGHNLFFFLFSVPTHSFWDQVCVLLDFPWIQHRHVAVVDLPLAMSVLIVGLVPLVLRLRHTNRWFSLNELFQLS